ncbi:DNA polymerase I [Butyrivibrio sp. MC2013]|uniref:DNA polymerase I n=1 Tax=Butyrivibrio sp. MC2013 TaxID=1280686 RepID=UPI000424EAC3|nr:DNA polymerase I [Butyrivibrio sp. MC2013]
MNNILIIDSNSLLALLRDIVPDMRDEKGLRTAVLSAFEHLVDTAFKRRPYVKTMLYAGSDLSLDLGINMSESAGAYFVNGADMTAELEEIRSYCRSKNAELSEEMDISITELLSTDIDDTRYTLLTAGITLKSYAGDKAEILSLELTDKSIGLNEYGAFPLEGLDAGSGSVSGDNPEDAFMPCSDNPFDDDTDSSCGSVAGSAMGAFAAGVSSKQSPYREVKNRETADELIRKCREYASGHDDRFIGFAAEGDELSGEDIVGLCLYTPATGSFYIKSGEGFDRAYFDEILSGLSEDCRLAGFDLKRSYRFYTPYEIDHQKEAGSFDILIAAYLLDPNNGAITAEYIAKLYLDTDIPDLKKRLGDSSKKPLPPYSVLRSYDLLYEYLSDLARISAMAAPILEDKLVSIGELDIMRKMEMPLSYVLYDMQKEGIICKREELESYGYELTAGIDRLESRIYEAAGEVFNINSPKQLGQILFEKMGIEGGKKTKTGYSTSADVLEKIAVDEPIVRDILEYRGLTKLRSTYAEGLADYIGPDNRIHTQFNQTVTATGRISSSEPNLQNIPMRTELGRQIRKVFVPKEGYIFTDADYSQVELRILADMSGDPGLIDDYRSGRDIHRATASRVFHTPFDEVTAAQRSNAKAVNFGIVYGISVFGLANDLNISREEAASYMDGYFLTYPGVKAYQESSVEFAKEHGYSLTRMGRRRPIPELKDSVYMKRQFGERVAMNAPIQGTAADIMKIAMINVYMELRKRKLKSKLILQIHDELLIETAPDEKELVAEILKKGMEEAAELKVPLLAECSTGYDWYEAK